MCSRPGPCRSLGADLIRRVAPPVLGLLVACGTGSHQGPTTIRLTRLGKPASVAAAPIKPEPFPRTEWRFNPPSSQKVDPRFDRTGGFEAGPGVAALSIREGRLMGRTTSGTPLLRVERFSGLDSGDLLHAVEIKLRVSAGSQLSVDFERDPNIDFADTLSSMKDFPWDVKTPLLPGGAAHTYTLYPHRTRSASDIRHLLIRPTDSPGASFELESVRLIFRAEHLAAIPSGMSWQGLGGVYHEAYVSRSPETTAFDVQLPDRPWLDLTIGTVEEVPVTFRVRLQRQRPSDRGEGELLLERTVTRPHRWERAPLDLLAHAGSKVRLSLSLSSEKPGALGFWGSPVIRPRLGDAAATTTRGPEPPRGIILIWADTLRADHLDAYGYGRNTAPRLKRMAEQGALFESCVGQATWTKVATPSLLTSLYPTTHGVHDFSDRIPASLTTLPEIYQEAGYATLSLSSILFTGQFTNLHQGFDEVHEDGSLPDRDSSKTAREYVDRVLPWLEAHRETPFFVFLHVSDPHDPYRPYAPYDTRWADSSRFEQHERDAKRARDFISDPLLKRFGMPTREELVKAGIDARAYLETERDWYDGSILAMDAEIGRLLEGLRGMGIDRSTLVVFTSDHGEEFFEHGRMFHGQSTYGELNHVALILRRPGSIPENLRLSETVRTIDLMPTLLEMSGLKGPASMQGRSLLPLLKGSVLASSGSGLLAAASPGERPGIWQERPAFTEKAATREPVGGPPPRDTESYAIVMDGWKLVQNTVRKPTAPEYELFDVRNDPLNLTDLSAANPEKIRDLSRTLQKWKAEALAARAKSAEEETRALSPEELERLRSLGYVQ